MYLLLQSIFDKIFPTMQFMSDLWSAFPMTVRFLAAVFFGLGCMVTFIRFFL